VFQALSEDYPELPEPYNNLATLYAAKGQYEKAKTALEMAIQVNPSYGVAYENLGDVYAKLASQAYDKALQLDRNNTTASGKLAAIRSAFAAKAAPGAPKSEPPKSGTALQGATTLAAGATPVKTVAVNAAATQSPASAMPEAKSRGDVLRAVDAWAAAWSARDLDAYLAAYSKAFLPEGRTRAEWEAARRASFPASGPVQVSIEQPRVSLRSDAEAEVTFLQHYRSDRARLDTHKTLRLSREDGGWRIAEERIPH
jgi:tetratricopeptide (TPR) repeat protein